MLSGFISRLQSTFRNVAILLSSLAWRKSDDTVLFGGWFGDKFADNSRYLFQYASDNRVELELKNVIWVTRNENLCCSIREMGYQAFLMDSPESLYFHKRARLHIICNQPVSIGPYHGDIMGEYSFRAKRINLWHGVAGLKGVNYASNEYLNRREKNRIIHIVKENIYKHCKYYRLMFTKPGGWGDCYYLSNSQTETESLRKYFLLPQTRYINSMYPRNCKCPRLTENENQAIEKIKRHKHSFLFLPTFRSTNTFYSSNLAEYLSAVLKNFDILWIQKPHSADNHQMVSDEGNDNILSLEPSFDVNVIMSDITAVVTDYSSVWADAMFHRKPVFFFIPDFEEYMNKDRGFLINPKDIMCGPKSFTLEELKKQIILCSSDFSKAKTENYETVRGMYWGKERSLGEIWNDILNATR